MMSSVAKNGRTNKHVIIVDFILVTQYNFRNFNWVVENSR
jgi:hypothetical protein